MEEEESKGELRGSLRKSTLWVAPEDLGWERRGLMGSETELCLQGVSEIEYPEFGCSTTTISGLRTAMAMQRHCTNSYLVRKSIKDTERWGKKEEKSQTL